MKPLRTRALRLFGAAAVASLIVTACGDDSDDSDDSDEITPTTEAEESDDALADEDVSDESDPDEGQQIDADVTEPGTSLTVGDTAVIPVEYSDEEGTVEMTVVSIEEGDTAEMSDFDLDDDTAGMVPHYVTFSFTKVEGGELSGVGPESGASGLTEDGSPAQELSLIGSFEPCNTTYADDEFDDGETYETCRVYLADAGSPVTSVGYFGGYGDPYYDNPITWGS